MRAWMDVVTRARSAKQALVRKYASAWRVWAKRQRRERQHEAHACQVYQSSLLWRYLQLWTKRHGQRQAVPRMRDRFQRCNDRTLLKAMLSRCVDIAQSVACHYTHCSWLEYGVGRQLGRLMVARADAHRQHTILASTLHILTLRHAQRRRLRNQEALAIQSDNTRLKRVAWQCVY